MKVIKAPLQVCSKTSDYRSTPNTNIKNIRKEGDEVRGILRTGHIVQLYMYIQGMQGKRTLIDVQKSWSLNSANAMNR